jgi:hypothetical protein
MKRRTFLAALAAPREGFTLRDISASSLEISEQGRPALVYNHGMMLAEGVKEQYRRACYAHPVYAPDGTVVTDDFPKDHPHHRGLCWSWPIVKFDGRTHDVWAVSGMHQRFVKWKRRAAEARRAVLHVENGWFVGAKQAVREDVELVVHAARAGRRAIDLNLEFEAVGEPVEIAGREVKGYGGFGVRFAPRTETVIRTERGVEEKDTDLVRHPWAELEGVFQGRRAGMRIEDDARNPGSPAAWCLRHYGYIAPNCPGLASIVLRPGAPLQLRYRITVFSAT